MIEIIIYIWRVVSICLRGQLGYIDDYYIIIFAKQSGSVKKVLPSTIKMMDILLVISISVTSTELRTISARV